MREKVNNQNDNTNEEGQAEPESNLSSCGPGCECKTEKRFSNRTKAIISLIIILAAGAVLTRTIIRKAGTETDDNNQAFASAQVPENKRIVSIADKKNETRIDESASEKTIADSENKSTESTVTEGSFWKAPLNSLSSLNTVAAGNDAVIVLVSEDAFQKTAPEVKVIDAAAKTITSRGVNIATFSLMKNAPEFSNLSKQLSGSGVLVMVKGRGMGGVPSTELTEEKLLQAYVSASQPRSGCGPTCAPSDCK